MERRLLFLGILIISIHPNLRAQRSGIQSSWHGIETRQPTIVDYQEEDNIFYRISNNLDFLHFSLMVPDRVEQQKLLLFGLTIYIDPAGKSKKDLAILYPYRRTSGKYSPKKVLAGDSALMELMEAEMPTRPSPTGGSGNPNMTGSRRRPLRDFDVIKYDIAERSRIMVLKGSTDTADIVAITSTNPVEVHGNIKFDSMGVLYYSLAIPFVKVPVRESMKESGFSIGLETGFFNPEQSSPIQGGRPGGPGGMGNRPGGAQGRTGSGASRQGGPGTGGMGGRQMMSPEQRQSMMEQVQALSIPTKFWIKRIILADEE